MRILRLLLAAVAASFLLVARAERVFPVTGVVRVGLEAGRITVSHEDIPGYMPGMTMAFDVDPGARADAARLRPGEKVRFALHVDENRVVVEDIRVIGSSALPAPTMASPEVVRLHEGDTIPIFTLQDEDGCALTRASLESHLTLVTFMFTRCPVPNFCPLMARRFGDVQRVVLSDPNLDGRVRLLSITLDPAFDRPAVLKAYGAAVGANPAVWQFGTGSEAQVTSLVRAFSVYREQNGVTLDHTLCTALIGEQGRILQLWRGNGWTVDEVHAAMSAALEATK